MVDGLLAILNKKISMIKDITIYLIARLNSERLPKKMIIPFDEINNHSLFERALKR